MRPLVAELTKAPGFISWLGMVIVGRMYTLTAWESADAVQEIMRSSLHKDAVKRFFTEDFGAAAATGVWIRIISTRSGSAAPPAAAFPR